MSSSIVAAAAALREALCGFDPGVFSGDDCARIAEELTKTEKVCAGAGRLAALRASECKAHQARGFNDAADWLAKQTGTTPGQARKSLTNAGKLGDHPDTRDALLAGEVSMDQAGEILDTAGEVPGSERELLDLAREGDLRRLKEKARDVRLEAIKPEELHQRQVKARTCRAWRNDFGMIAFTGVLAPETGVPFLTRLEREADRLMRAAQEAGGEVEAWDAYAADAFALLVGGADGSKPRPGQTDLTIVCDLRAWRRGHAHEGEPCHILDAVRYRSTWPRSFPRTPS